MGWSSRSARSPRSTSSSTSVTPSAPNQAMPPASRTPSSGPSSGSASRSAHSVQPSAVRPRTETAPVGAPVQLAATDWVPSSTSTDAVHPGPAELGAWRSAAEPRGGGGRLGAGPAEGHDLGVHGPGLRGRRGQRETGEHDPHGSPERDCSEHAALAPAKLFRRVASWFAHEPSPEGRGCHHGDHRHHRRFLQVRGPVSSESDPRSRLRVSVDVTSLLHEVTGVGVFTRELVDGLAARDDVDLTVFAVSWRGRSELASTAPAGATVRSRPMPARVARARRGPAPISRRPGTWRAPRTWSTVPTSWSRRAAVRRRWSPCTI